MNLLAQATAEERGFIVFQVFLVVLAGAVLAFAIYLVLYALLSPVLLAAGTERAKRAQRVMTGYAIVAPLVLSNLVAIFGLFAIQLAAVHWLYGGVAGPQRVLERAFADAGGVAPGGVQAEIVARLRACSGLQSGGYGGTMEFMTALVWFASNAINWVILLSLLVAMLRDLGATSWSFLAAPVQREIQGRPWGELIRTAAARFLHLLCYTLFAGALFVVGAVFAYALGWLTMRMIASLLVCYLAKIAVSTGGFFPFVLLGSFYVCMLEVLLLFLFVTGVLAFVASRSISMHIEAALATFFKLPHAAPPPPKLLPTAKAGGLLLAQVFAAVLPVWLAMRWVVAPLFPLLLAAPVGAFLHVVSFNVVLLLFKSWRHMTPIAVEAWAGRPWARRIPDPKSQSPTVSS